MADLEPSVYDETTVSEGLEAVGPGVYYWQLGDIEFVDGDVSWYELLTLTVNVSDDAPSSDTVADTLQTHSISVSDDAATAESADSLASALNPSVSDDAATAESVTFLRHHAISISDAATTSESVTFLRHHTLEVHDDAPASESNSQFVNPYFVDCHDDASTADAPSASVYYPGQDADVFDATAVDESVSAELPLDHEISVTDTTTVSESLTVPPFFYTEYLWETGDIEFVDGDVSWYELGTLTVSVSDTASTTDTASATQVDTLEYNVSVDDETAVLETKSASVSALIANVNEAATLAEQVTSSLRIYAFTTDSASTAESAAASVPLGGVSVSDATAPTDTPEVAVGTPVEYNVEVFDNAPTSEPITTTLSDLAIDAYDEASTAEQSVASTSALPVDVYDEAAATESSAADLQSDRSINVTDSSGVTEDVGGLVSGPSISVSDSTTITEPVLLELLELGDTYWTDEDVIWWDEDISWYPHYAFVIDVSDSTTLTDTASGAVSGIIETLNINRYELAYTTESATAIPPNALSVSRSDDAASSDVASVYVEDLLEISVTDSTAASESITSTTAALVISVSDETDADDNDDYATDSNTSLLLHFESDDGSTTPDSSGNAHTVYIEDGADTLSVQAKFGSRSLYLDGTDDNARIASHADLSFGGNPYTVDLWIYLPSLPTAGQIESIAFRSSDALSMTVARTAGGLLYLSFTGTGISNFSYYSPPLSAATWHHLAFIRGWGGDTDALAIVVDGENVQTGTATGDNDSSSDFYIGEQSTTHPLNAYIDAFRITKGVALWTAAFTPPTIKDAVSAELADLSISTSDTTTVEETTFTVVTAAGHLGFLTSDSTSTTESVTASLADLTISTSDDAATTDTITDIAYALGIVVSDTTSLAESVEVADIPYTISVHDDTSTTDIYTGTATLPGISVTDATTASESVTASRIDLVGKLYATITAVAPRARITSAAPTATFTATRPRMKEAA